MALRRAGRAIRAEGRMGRSHLLLVDDPGSAAENVDGTRRLKVFDPTGSRETKGFRCRVTGRREGAIAEKGSMLSFVHLTRWRLQTRSRHITACATVNVSPESVDLHAIHSRFAYHNIPGSV